MTKEPEDPQESGNDENKPGRREIEYAVSKIPRQKTKPEKDSVAGKPNDDELNPARENVTIRGANIENSNDFTASQVEDLIENGVKN